jgi:hypothetical protein
MVLFLMLFLAGCASWMERTWLRAPGWSRGVLVGETTAFDPSPFVLRDDGETVVLLADDDAAPPVLILTSLDAEGELAWARKYPVEIGAPERPALLWDGEALHLFWLAEQSVFYMQVDEVGENYQPAKIISDNYQASEFDVVLSPDGEIALWFAGPRHNPGVYAKPVGDFEARSIPIDARGMRPQLQYSPDGTLHAFWIQHPSGYEREAYLYAAFENGEIPPIDVRKIHDLDVTIAEVLHGPVFALDQDYGYLLWSEETRTGLSAGAITTYMITFDPADPEGNWAAEYLRVPVEYNLPWAAYPGGVINAGERVFLTGSELPTTGRIFDFSIDQQIGSESVTVFNVQADFLRRKSAWQIGAVFLQDGIPTSYQLLSFTTRESSNPYVKLSDEQYVYLTWLERGGGGRSRVYLATTEPDFRASVNQIRAADVMQVVSESLFGLASGVVLLPFVLVWMLAGVVVIAITWWARKEDQPLLKPGTLITLLLAVGVYWFSKTFMFPAIFEYVPFSAWIPIIPESWELPLRFGVPILISIIGIYTALRFTYLARHRSPLFFMLIFGLVDGVMTLAIYGVIFWGEV